MRRQNAQMLDQYQRVIDVVFAESPQNDLAEMGDLLGVSKPSARLYFEKVRATGKIRVNSHGYWVLGTPHTDDLTRIEREVLAVLGQHFGNHLRGGDWGRGTVALLAEKMERSETATSHAVWQLVLRDVLGIETKGTRVIAVWLKPDSGAAVPLVSDSYHIETKMERVPEPAGHDFVSLAEDLLIKAGDLSVQIRETSAKLDALKEERRLLGDKLKKALDEF